jgi:hypothetical protein
VSGTYICELYDSDNTRNCSKSYVINATGTWEYKTITFPPDTTGTFNNDNGDSMQVDFFLGVGSNFSSGPLQTTWGSYVAANRAVGQTNLASAINNYWQITGVQLTVGTVAPPFEFKAYAQELRECQRYYYKSTHNPSQQVGIGMIYSTNAAITVNRFPVPMRIAPTTAVIAGLTSGIDSGGTGRGFSASAYNTATTEDVSLVHTGGFNFTMGAACYVYTQAGGWNYAVSAEMA